MRTHSPNREYIYISIYVLYSTIFYKQTTGDLLARQEKKTQQTHFVKFKNLAPWLCHINELQ